MIVSVTGTRNGPTESQEHEASRIFNHWNIHELHHGQCAGVDIYIHKLVRSIDGGVPIIAHPGEGAFTVDCDADEFWSPRPYLARDKNLARVCDVLVAVPGENAEILRSGTWATVRYARKELKLVVIVNPDGSVRIY